MDRICKNKRPFQARFIRHHDHCAPLHPAAAAPPGFKTPFYMEKMLRLWTWDRSSEGICLLYPHRTSLWCAGWGVCAAFTCIREFWHPVETLSLAAIKGIISEWNLPHDHANSQYRRSTQIHWAAVKNRIFPTAPCIKIKTMLYFS